MPVFFDDHILFQSTPPPPSKELLEVLSRVSNKLASIGASLVILHDEYLIEAPTGKHTEAFEAVNELTDWQLAQMLKNLRHAKLTTVFPEGMTWEEWAAAKPTV